MRRDKFGSSSEKTPKEEARDQLYIPQIFNEIEVSADDAEEESCKITIEGATRSRKREPAPGTSAEEHSY